MKISAEDQAALQLLEESLWREDTRFDSTLMASVFAPDFFEFGRSGRIYGRTEMLGATRQPIQAVLPLPDLSIRLLNEVTAQVTYNSVVMSCGKNEYGRRSSIWSKSSNGWGLRFHQGTPYVP
ncbi:MAG: nuclear transport factor 2 family protein [Thermoanaerobaculaceae bacterium]|jgi:hypothetical protein